MLRRVCVMILALAAAACSGSGDPNEREPANKILARSTTDEMLPLETVQSQAPLAKPDTGSHAKKDGSAAAGEDDAAQADDAQTIAPLIESPPPPTDTIGAAISGKAAPEER